MVIVALIVGLVLGYGLSSLLEYWRVKDCERECAALQRLYRQRTEQDLQIAALFATAERMARQIVLQDKVDATRNSATRT